MGWQNAPVVGKSAWESAPVVGAAPATPEQSASFFRFAIPDVRDLAAGAVRGAGSIGATLLTPYDLLAGNTSSIGNPERRQAMDDALRSLGADPESGMYGAGKLGAEVAGTLGVGGGIANALRGLGVKSLPALEALTTGGFRTGAAPATMAGKAGDLALRSAAGGATGAAAAGLVNPEDAATGGVVGAMLPGVLKGAGAAGSAVGSVVRPDAQRADLARKAIDAGLPLGASDVSGNALVKGTRSFLDDVPLIGRIGESRKDAIQGAFNKAVGEKFGAAEAKLTPEVVDKAKKRMGAEFDRLWNANTLQYDAPLFQELQTLRASAQKLPQGEAGRLLSWIDDIEARMVPDASGNLSMPGDVANRLQSKLGRDVSNATGFLKNDLQSLRRAVLDGFNRGIAPEDAAALTKARGQYKAFKTVEPLIQKSEAGTAGRNVGDVPAALLPEAVRGSYGANIAGSPFADLSQIGSQFVADRVARTGGSARAMMQNSALFGGLAAGSVSNPLTALVGVPSAVALEMALSSPTLARALLRQGSGRPNPLLGLGYRAAPVLMADQ